MNPANAFVALCLCFVGFAFLQEGNLFFAGVLFALALLINKDQGQEN